VGQGVFEHGYSLQEIPLLQDEMAELELRLDRSVDVSSCIGNPGRFFAAGASHSKLPQLAQAVHQPGTGSHGFRDRSKALVEHRAVQGRDGPLELTFKESDRTDRF
jgi:hypothetical protein